MSRFYGISMTFPWISYRICFFGPPKKDQKGARRNLEPFFGSTLTAEPIRPQPGREISHAKITDFLRMWLEYVGISGISVGD